MSVLIKGMEMPENCFDCRYICGLRDSQKFTKNRRPDCPLIEIPPHGDLIDRDAYEYPGDLMDEPVIIPADPAEEGET